MHDVRTNPLLPAGLQPTSSHLQFLHHVSIFDLWCIYHIISVDFRRTFLIFPRPRITLKSGRWIRKTGDKSSALWRDKQFICLAHMPFFLVQYTTIQHSFPFSLLKKKKKKPTPNEILPAHYAHKRDRLVKLGAEKKSRREMCEKNKQTKNRLKREKTAESRKKRYDERAFRSGLLFIRAPKRR